MTQIRFAARIVADKGAVTTMEYGIIAAFFAVLLVGIFGNFGKTLVTLFSGVTSSL
jgi:Flp pilus assembly pilin Flp